MCPWSALLSFYKREIGELTNRLCCVYAREELDEVDCYSYLSLLVSPPPTSPGLVYLTQSRRAWDLAAATLKPLAQQYIVSSVMSHPIYILIF